MQTGEKIRAFRELRNYTQEYVANKLGMSQVNYSKIERGEITVSEDKINKIAEVLEVSPQYIKDFNPTYFFSSNQSSSPSSSNIQVVGVPQDKMEQMYQAQIQALQETIVSLKNQVALLQEMVEHRKKQ
jgi:transcriptional regulator with XRE-family HTH domain